MCFLVLGGGQVPFHYLIGSFSTGINVQMSFRVWPLCELLSISPADSLGFQVDILLRYWYFCLILADIFVDVYASWASVFWKFV